MLACRRLFPVTALFLAAAAPARPGEPVDYLKEIKPLLREKCAACHGALKQKARLRLDTAALARKGGRSGPAVRAGDAAGSLLIGRVTAPDPAERMPPEGPPLAPAQVARLRAWIAQGARAPAGEVPEPDPRDHWAFRPPRRPAVPAVRRAGWADNPIDAFLAAEHEKRGLAPRPPADRALLLRRVYLDLVGLPPTRAERAAFLADRSPDAYEKVVDRLLADPRHGERWGRHWMDVWRYSDWYGRRMVPDVWNSAPQVWRWRDWIVCSLNRNRGYDRMVREMLAADEIRPGDDGAAVATGFLVRNWYALNPNDWMRSNVEHVGKAFLGLTFNCAHCHDHKYDPITQLDYFRFRAFFEPLGVRQDPVPGEADPGPFQEYQYSVLRKVQRLGLVRAFDKNPAAPTWFYTGGDERNRVKEKGPIRPGLPAAFGKLPTEIRPVELPARAYALPGRKYPRVSTGRRKALAEWITARDNPLAARVAVNHIWMRHFHAPLVASVFDFGRNGARPTHPELLDWLAVEFMESGWSMKHLHRLIVTSRAYRMTSSLGAAPAEAARDPENRFLWRMNVGRMEAEVVRDSLLHVAGLLEQRLGGQELENSQALTTRRRSLYYSCNPEGDGKSEFGALFDAPDAGECYRRTRTVVPQQALALTNSRLVHEVSARLAASLWEELPAADPTGPAAFVSAAYEAVLGRRPGPAELHACADFLKAAGPRAREGLVRVLLNHNDFVTVR
jgi:hypothetical protein